MSGVRLETISRQEEGMRVDRWFKSHYPNLGHGQLEKLCRKGSIRVDGGRVKPSSRVAAGQELRIPPEVQGAKRSATPTPKRIPDEVIERVHQSVIYRDKDILALNKPSGLAVQGGSKTEIHVDAVLPSLQFDADEAPRLVHRLDRDTSGILVLARNRLAAQSLTRSFARREVEKIYWALVHGLVRPTQGHINLPLVKRAARHGGERMFAAESNDPEAMRARTDYAEMARVGQVFSWLAFRPITGRTHQIRVHAASINHPIVGDPKYRIDHENNDFGGIIEKKLHLHARSVRLPHPSAKKMLELIAPLQGHMKASWRQLGLEENDTENPFHEAD
jgi:23S rRNA pseudouridine955/2504/2580 synthase